MCSRFQDIVNLTIKTTPTIATSANSYISAKYPILSKIMTSQRANCSLEKEAVIFKLYTLFILFLLIYSSSKFSSNIILDEFVLLILSFNAITNSEYNIAFIP